MPLKYDGALDLMTAEQLRQLLKRLAEQLTENQREAIAEFIRVGEPTIAIESLGGAVCEQNITLDEKTYLEIEKLGNELGGDPSFWMDIKRSLK